MNENLSISDIQRIMGTSYPTALKFATAHGKQIDGRWVVPLDEVKAEVNRLAAPAIAMLTRMDDWEIDSFEKSMEPTS